MHYVGGNPTMTGEDDAQEVIFSYMAQHNRTVACTESLEVVMQAYNTVARRNMCSVRLRPSRQLHATDEM